MLKYDMEKVLPHKKPMVLVDDIIEYDLEKHSVSVLVKINENKVFFDNSINGVPAVVGIEFMAQAIGCYSYFLHNMQPPKIGFLLGTRLYENKIPCFENGKSYTVTAKEVFTDYELVSFECFIYNENKECAKSVINAYLPSDEKDFIGKLDE